MKRKPRSQAEFQELVQSSINLWSVNEVEVNGRDIIINMGDRKRSEDAETIVRSPTWVARAYSAIVKNEIILRANDADTAQRWVQGMYAGPFDGQAQQAFDDMMQDGVLVVLRRDPFYPLRNELDAIAVGFLAAVSLALSLALMVFMGIAPGILVSSVLHIAVLLIALRETRHATILEHVAVIPMQEALAIDLLAQRNHGQDSKHGGKSRKSVHRGKSIARGDASDEDDDDDDDEDEGFDKVSAEDVGDGIEFTLVEKTLIKELRERVSDLTNPRITRDPYALEIYKRYIDENFRLVRFLRARNLNLRKAEKLLRTSLAWRIEYRAAEIHEEFDLPRWMLEYFGSPDIIDRILDRSDRLPWYFHDEDGRLAVFLRVGRLNHRLMFKKLNNDGEMLFRAGVWLFEMILKDLEAHFESSGRTIPAQISIVMDLEGFSMSKQLPVNTALSLARRYVGKLLDGYPEVLAHVTVVNAPWLFNSLWTLFQPFFPERVLNKIWIGGSNVRACQKQIRSIHGPDQTPAAYGGNVKEDGDIYCPSRVPCQGPFLDDEGASLLSR
ncbi:SEC14-like protein 2 [Hondaea fermentalgiana]|uniref:SEC14-like protein 2 n=1 Tax=Hondaea fermentalgiana TaxID=2315210 RepID=A0A2R5G4N6_9STRA|nr:SEC14-like protein 2 [Hondaea fermentalgiana]|eukprot:GBG25992.1 SEC14-like protein 2 [Hondaea fermentalgiana]